MYIYRERERERETDRTPIKFETNPNTQIDQLNAGIISIIYEPLKIMLLFSALYNMQILDSLQTK